MSHWRVIGIVLLDSAPNIDGSVVNDGILVPGARETAPCAHAVPSHDRTRQELLLVVRSGFELGQNFSQKFGGEKRPITRASVSVLAPPQQAAGGMSLASWPRLPGADHHLPRRPRHV